MRCNDGAACERSVRGSKPLQCWDAKIVNAHDFGELLAIDGNGHRAKVRKIRIAKNNICKQ